MRLPCDECVAELTEKAIANSFKLKTLEERITLIEQRLAVAEDRIEYTSKKKWTNYISANPVDIIQDSETKICGMSLKKRSVNGKI
ncbi:MAG: hypothetical protein QNJ53_06415 [Pleurocapsa sp. MO_192.B19]|nr:hypothetical protein [Pleurocapsa sp. MO_192.B19]